MRTHSLPLIPRLIPLLIVLIAALPALAHGTGSCASLLDAADLAESRADTENHDLYTKALQRCESRSEELPVELEARVATTRAYVERTYDKSYEAAVKTLENALASVTERGGVDHPARIALLEGLAEAVASRAIQEPGTPPGYNQRVVEMSEEALALREKLYGADSTEAAQGHSWLAAVFQGTAPELAEEHASRAVEISRDRQASDPRTYFEALSMLSAAQRALGKDAEAEKTRVEINEVLERMEPRGV